MSQYPMIVTTLWEFGLITEDQANEALATYDREYREMEERAKHFRRDWYARHPWWHWKRYWMSWRSDFIVAERGE